MTGYHAMVVKKHCQLVVRMANTTDTVVTLIMEELFVKVHE